MSLLNLALLNILGNMIPYFDSSVIGTFQRSLKVSSTPKVYIRSPCVQVKFPFTKLIHQYGMMFMSPSLRTIQSI